MDDDFEMGNKGEHHNSDNRKAERKVFKTRN